MIEAGEAEQQSAPPCFVGCPWLDYIRSPKGENCLQCRLTGHLYGSGRKEDSACLPACAYPGQAVRGHCRHMDFANVLLTRDELPLPRIGCRAHGNWDAPSFCARCPDYELPE